MFHLAEVLGKTIGEIERMPASEMMEWGAYLNMKAKGQKPEMTPDEMMAAAQHITRGAARGT